MSTESHRVLVLQRDNPCNTIIFDQDTEEVVYTVVTEHGDHTTTKLMNVYEKVIASWQWRNIRSDILTLGDGVAAPASAWLRKSMVPFSDSVYFTDHQKQEYTWKGNAPGLQLELYSQKDKKHPIAQFKRAYSYKDTKQTPPVQVSAPSKLTLDPRGQEIQDMVVISFCMLERDRRSEEHSTTNRAEALAVPPVAAAGMGF